MATSTKRLTSVMRWAVVVWIIFCASQMVRWRHFDEPTMVGGWFWIGSIWAGLLSMIGSSNLRRNDWGARIALFAPMLLVLFVAHRTNLRGRWCYIGPNWSWPFWCIVLDIAILTWGREISSSRSRRLQGFALAIGALGILCAVAIRAINEWVIVGTLAPLAFALLRRDEASPRPNRVVPATLVLAAIDACELVAMIRIPDDRVEWGHLDVMRMIAVGFLGWCLSRPSPNQDSAGGVVSHGWFGLLPFGMIRSFVWSGLAWIPIVPK